MGQVEVGVILQSEAARLYYLPLRKAQPIRIDLGEIPVELARWVVRVKEGRDVRMFALEAHREPFDMRRVGRFVEIILLDCRVDEAGEIVPSNPVFWKVTDPNGVHPHDAVLRHTFWARLAFAPHAPGTIEAQIVEIALPASPSPNLPAPPPKQQIRKPAPESSPPDRRVPDWIEPSGPHPLDVTYEKKKRSSLPVKKSGKEKVQQPQETVEDLFGHLDLSSSFEDLPLNPSLFNNNPPGMPSKSQEIKVRQLGNTPPFPTEEERRRQFEASLRAFDFNKFNSAASHPPNGNQPVESHAAPIQPVVANSPVKLVGSFEREKVEMQSPKISVPEMFKDQVLQKVQKSPSNSSVKDSFKEMVVASLSRSPSPTQLQMPEAPPSPPTSPELAKFLNEIKIDPRDGSFPDACYKRWALLIDEDPLLADVIAEEFSDYYAQLFPNMV
ncbi:unnamed protein product, partial [Mesorhabditis spiculigera]